MSKNNNDNVLQVRVSAGDGVLHVQGKGEVTANRMVMLKSLACLRR